MSKYQKLLEQIKNNPKNVNFETIKKLLTKLGYGYRNSGGSHYVFNKDNYPTITIPYNKPIKAVYVKQVIRLIEELEND